MEATLQEAAGSRCLHAELITEASLASSSLVVFDGDRKSGEIFSNALQY